MSQYENLCFNCSVGRRLELLLDYVNLWECCCSILRSKENEYSHWHNVCYVIYAYRQYVNGSYNKLSVVKRCKTDKDMKSKMLRFADSAWPPFKIKHCKKLVWAFILVGHQLKLFCCVVLSIHQFCVINLIDVAYHQFSSLCPGCTITTQYQFWIQR